VENTIIVPMSGLYERAWNKVVRERAHTTMNAIIDDPHGREASAAAKEAAKLAEKWEEMGHNVIAPYHPDEEATGPYGLAKGSDPF
jgi:hypothetical protein